MRSAEDNTLCREREKPDIATEDYSIRFFKSQGMAIDSPRLKELGVSGFLSDIQGSTVQ